MVLKELDIREDLYDCSNLYIQSLRKWDKFTPYSIHPIWCAMTILHETQLPKKLRILGYKVLLFHDAIEKAGNQELFYQLTEDKELILNVQAMTFENIDDEINNLHKKSKFVKLLKLYDKVSNLMDSDWMDGKLLGKYLTHTLNLKCEAEKNYGELNIIKIAEAITCQKIK